MRCQTEHKKKNINTERKVFQKFRQSTELYIYLFVCLFMLMFMLIFMLDISYALLKLFSFVDIDCSCRPGVISVMDLSSRRKPLNGSKKKKLSYPSHIKQMGIYKFCQSFCMVKLSFLVEFF